MIGIGTDFANLSGERSYSLSYYTKGALIHPCGRVRSAEGLSPHREISPRSDMAALPQQGAAPLAPLRGYRIFLHLQRKGNHILRHWNQ